MKWDDLLKANYKAGGRGPEYDCYGLVIECCKRNKTPLKDISDKGFADASELGEYVKGMNVVEVDTPSFGNVVQCEYDNRLHIGYMIDNMVCLHMTSKGARITPAFLLKRAKYFEVVT